LAIYKQVASEPSKSPLPLLVQRVGAALGRNPPPLLELPYPPGVLPAAPPVEMAKYIVSRLGGTNDPEMRYSGLEMFGRMVKEGDVAPKFMAEHDSPYLVALAQAIPEAGCPLLREYIAIHTGNPYADY